MGIWTEEEREFLRANYSTMAMEDLATRLSRTLCGIYGQAKAMGISRKKGKQSNSTFLITFAVPREHLAWMRQETPNGATIADTVRAIITDAYLDAKEEA